MSRETNFTYTSLDLYNGLDPIFFSLVQLDLVISLHANIPTRYSSHPQGKKL